MGPWKLWRLLEPARKAGQEWSGTEDHLALGRRWPAPSRTERAETDEPLAPAGLCGRLAALVPLSKVASPQK